MKFTNIKSTIRVALIELNSMFYSPVAWLILIIFTVQIGYGFSIRMSGLIKYVYMDGTSEITSRIFTDQMFGFMSSLLETLYFYIPLLTMGLMSKEYYSGSIKLLYSSPIKNSAIILGKFLAMVVYGLALMAILGIFVTFSAIVVKDFELAHVLTSMLGIFLLFLSYSAIGLFMSSLTKYQVVAALGTLAVLAALNYVGIVGQDIDAIRNITYWLSISGRSYGFINGIISSEDVAYYLMIIFFFISLSILKLNTEKVIMSKKVQLIKYSAIVIVMFMVGFFTSSPFFKIYYDATSNKANTLSKESMDVVSRLKNDITITTYVNVLCEDVGTGLPRNRNHDEDNFDIYMRFMPTIKLNYVYYWDKVYNEYLEYRYKGLSDEEKARRFCISENLDYDMFMTPEQIAQYTKERGIDLKAEGNQFIRVVDCGDKRAILRIYNDTKRHPDEAEISSALKRFVSPVPMVGFITGYGSRDITNHGDRGYRTFASDKNFRESLVNHGFDTKTVNLDNDSLDDIDILVISDLRDPLSDVATAKANEYIAKGGNLFILGDINRGENINMLTESIGVKFGSGVLVYPNKYSSPNVIFADFTAESTPIFKSFERYRNWGWMVSLPTCAPIDYSKATSFNVKEVLRSPDGTWLEFETTDFEAETPIFNPDAGEIKAPFATLIAMSRNVNGKEQRILVSGDADFIANQELTINRSEGGRANFQVITGSFRWLSNDQFPIDTALDSTTDDDINLPKSFSKWVKTISYIIIPLVLILSAILVILRRQRK